jgi:hypothetical protein
MGASYYGLKVDDVNGIGKMICPLAADFWSQSYKNYKIFSEILHLQASAYAKHDPYSKLILKISHL